MTPLSASRRAELELLLHAHRPWDRVEATHLATIRAFVLHHPDPFCRSISEGHLTGSAFVLDPEGRLLLTHHRKLDLWIQLGGHAGLERQAPAVALREAREESGLPDLQFDARLTFPDGSPRLLDVDVHDIPARPPEPAHQHLDLRFLLRTTAPETIVEDPRESHALAWVTLAEARQRCDPGVQRALTRLEALSRATG